MVEFSSYLTNHGDSVAIQAYHQALRYGIECERREAEKEKKLSQDLQRVGEWIEEEMNG